MGSVLRPPPRRLRPRPGRAVRVLPAAGLVLALSACTQGPPPEQPPEGPTTSAAAEAPASPRERLGLRTGWGPDAADLDRAARRVLRLGLPQLAGQVIVADFPGTGAPSAMVRRLHLGGVIAFEDNVASAEQVRSLTGALQRRDQRGWPVLVGVDQEGGTVERIGAAATRFPTFMSAGAADDPALTRDVYAASGAELRRLGFNLDFAPDADVTVGPADPTIGSRSAGGDPDRVAAQAVAAARGFRDGGVSPVLKHFPGHGSVTTDSHLDLPVQGLSRAELRRRDLVPFRAAVEAGLPAIMVGHLAVRSVDPARPATVSAPVVSGLLREELGFAGVVASDALDMGALRGVPTPAVGFLRAGGDLVLMPPDPAATRAAIVAAVRSGDLPERRLQQAAARMVALAEQSAPTAEAPRRSGGTGAAQASRRLSAAAITLATGPCSGPLVEGALVPMGSPVAVGAFRAAAARAGVELGGVRWTRPPRPAPTGSKKQDRRRLEAWRGTPPTAVVEGTPVRFDTVAGPGEPGVLVATGTPYLLGAGAAPVEIATYATTAVAMDVLVEVLRGRARAPGRLPVAVDGVARRGC